MPFIVHEPDGEETPVVVEVPHASLLVPSRFLPALCAPLHAIGRDADLFVDELYGDAPREGATLVVARTSRYVVDLNRGETDLDADVVEGAPPGARATRGIVWRLTGDGAPVLSRRLSRAELEARLDEVYRPYHRAVRVALERKVARFGHAVLLAAHSMPSASRGQAVRTERADVVPGTRGRTTSSGRYIDLVEEHAREQGWSVRHDDPYRGGYTTAHYGSPAAGVHAVQVELARRLYMDEDALTPRRPEPFDAVRRWCRGLVAKLGRRALA